MVHGFYQPEEDSLRLLPGDTWIDVGDFKGNTRYQIVSGPCVPLDKFITIVSMSSFPKEDKLGNIVTRRWWFMEFLLFQVCVSVTRRCVMKVWQWP
jgi:hypothetical protein